MRRWTAGCWQATDLNQFINVAVAEKLAALRIERYFVDDEDLVWLAGQTGAPLTGWRIAVRVPSNLHGGVIMTLAPEPRVWWGDA